MFTKIALMSTLLALMVGCSTYIPAGMKKGAEGADAALDAALWYVCKGASIGAVNRRFGSSPDAYKALCAGHNMGVVGE